MELSEIVELIHQEYPDKVLVDLSEYETIMSDTAKKALEDSAGNIVGLHFTLKN